MYTEGLVQIQAGPVFDASISVSLYESCLVDSVVRGFLLFSAPQTYIYQTKEIFKYSKVVFNDLEMLLRFTLKLKLH